VLVVVSYSDETIGAVAVVDDGDPTTIALLALITDVALALLTALALPFVFVVSVQPAAKADRARAHTLVIILLLINCSPPDFVSEPKHTTMGNQYANVNAAFSVKSNEKAPPRLFNTYEDCALRFLTIRRSAQRNSTSNQA
jgi:hypothetical protein